MEFTTQGIEVKLKRICRSPSPMGDVCIFQLSLGEMQRCKLVFFIQIADAVVRNPSCLMRSDGVCDLRDT